MKRLPPCDRQFILDSLGAFGESELVSVRGWRNFLGCSVAAAGSWLLPPANAAVIIVTNDYPTIQAAIDAASSNDTIQVQAGT